MDSQPAEARSRGRYQDRAVARRGADAGLRVWSVRRMAANARGGLLHVQQPRECVLLRADGRARGAHTGRTVRVDPRRFSRVDGHGAREDSAERGIVRSLLALPAAGLAGRVCSAFLYMSLEGTFP